jgi:hypothetical protein
VKILNWFVHNPMQLKPGQEGDLWKIYANIGIWIALSFVMGFKLLRKRS